MPFQEHLPVKHISSRQNPAFKLLLELVSQAKARRSHQAAWLEGERLCQAYAEQSLHQAAILVVSDVSGPLGIPVNVRSVCKEIWQVQAALFKEITQLETASPWGLIIPTQASSALDAAHIGDLVVLDRLQDPGNAGSILRSAAAAGVQTVFAIKETVDLWSPKVLRAAMGAHFLMDIRQDCDASAVRQLCAEAKIPMLATAHRQDAISLFDPGLGLAQPVAWIFGQEGSGIAAFWQQRATPVSIPQNQRLESLNVAAAAAVCLFESLRRKTKNEGPG